MSTCKATVTNYVNWLRVKTIEEDILMLLLSYRDNYRVHKTAVNSILAVHSGFLLGDMLAA